MPLKESAFLILSALAAEPTHGYGIMKDVEQQSDGAVRLRPGTLYAVLAELAEAGLIEVDSEEVVQSRLRRNYRLTAPGAQQLAAEADRRRAAANTAGRRLRNSGLLAGGGAA
ncbi:PadR family transcriptional regulator [Dactylosporangium sp. NPDC049140]|jgi:DNA-binding PadR family transcriptional regulator|uniref:PadR family transcriptional regulator n=1 Tax=unclassified Dactylosporangium TaxID=2621675 RepID=UPI0033C8B4E5